MRLPIILLRTRQKYSSSWFCFHALPNLKMYGTKTIYPLQGQNNGINTFCSLYWQEIQVFFIHKERQDSWFSQISWEVHAKKTEMSLLTSAKELSRIIKTFSPDQWPIRCLCRTSEGAAWKDSTTSLWNAPQTLLLLWGIPLVFQGNLCITDFYFCLWYK